MNKRFETIWSTIQIIIIYMFSGLSMGVAITLIHHEFPIQILLLIYLGSLCTIQMLHIYCKKNGLKVFGKLHLNLLGFIIWTISMVFIIHLKS